MTAPPHFRTSGMTVRRIGSRSEGGNGCTNRYRHAHCPDLTLCATLGYARRRSSVVFSRIGGEPWCERLWGSPLRYGFWPGVARGCLLQRRPLTRWAARHSSACAAGGGGGGGPGVADWREAGWKQRADEADTAPWWSVL